jgi:predicted nucleotide-binding protein
MPAAAPAPYIGRVLEEAFRNVQAVIALFTPDEHVLARDAPATDESSWRLQARPNVLIEAGMALITHPDRTVIVVLGDQELPSDLAGRWTWPSSRREDAHSFHERDSLGLQRAGRGADQFHRDPPGQRGVRRLLR